LWFCLLAVGLSAQDETLFLANEAGARIDFTNTAAGWTWTQLVTPTAPEPLQVTEGELRYVVGEGEDSLVPGWSLVTNDGGRLVFERAAPQCGVMMRRIFSFGPAEHVLRVETWIRSTEEAKLVHEIGLLTLKVAGESFVGTGPSPASFPLFGQGLFAGVEDVCAESRADGETLRLWQTPGVSVGGEWQFVAAAVVGWHAPRAALFLPGESRTRDAFLQYLDTIRVQPRGINLHSDTWWTLPCPFTEGDVLNDVAALRTGFFERTGMFFDTYALDLGWSDPHTLWEVDATHFPAGLDRVRTELAALNCRMGMWLSPSSGYEPGLDNTWLEAQGYEMTRLGEDARDQVACFALGGRYQREFTERIVGYAKEHGLGHVIFDGLVPSCDNPAHLHGTGVASVYAIAAGFKDVMDRLRAQNPAIVLEPLSCGHPPSPWWNLHTPFLLGPAGDDVPFGRVPAPDWTEALISARDIAYRARQEEWLVRTQTLETFDIIRQSPGVFQNMAAMAVGRGRWFVSANIRPELMQPADWDFLAALVRWQRANQRFLVDARQIGGRPENREAYGYLFHHADKELYCIRNPWMEERSIRLPARVRAAADVRMIYPRRGLVGRVQPGEDGPTVVLGPYETMFLETAPLTDAAPAEVPTISAEVAAEAPVVVVTDLDPELNEPGLLYQWSGSLQVPAVLEPELCVLVAGGTDVADAVGDLWVDGRAVPWEKSGSAGQFGAAVEPSAENWTWFVARLEPGGHEFALEVQAPRKATSVGVFLRGGVPVTNDPEPAEGPVFPQFQPDRRPWSQTLQPLTAFGAEPASDAGS
jgi:hypothetical protein